MKSVQRRLSSYVRSPLSEARIERMWASIAERETRPRGRLQKRTTMGLLLVAAAIVLVFVGNSLRRRSPLQVKPDTLEGWVFETGTVKLPDGSTLEIAEGSRLTVGTADEQAVRLRLVRGRVTCEVAAARRVLLAAGSFELDSRDARFSVERSLSGALNVRVDRGTVELRDPTRTVATLSAGQSWSESPIVVAPTASTIAPAATTPPPVPTVAKTVAPQPSVAKEIDPATLFALGDEARLAGKHAEAAGYFDRLRTHHRDDPRAGLAAYQLGRIRLGSLHDPAGAASAFADAILLSKDAPFRDDAEVGRIEALDEAGELEACRKARIAFVEAHPTSPLLSRANKRCP